MAGVPLGAWLLPHVDMQLFRAGVGTRLVVYCSIMLCAGSLPVLTRGGRGLDGVVGAIGGVMGGLAGLTGPAPTLWCLLQGWDRDAQRAHSLTLTIPCSGCECTGASGSTTSSGSCCCSSSPRAW